MPRYWNAGKCRSSISNINKKMNPENRPEGRGEVHFLRSCAFQSLPEIRHRRVGAGSNLLIPCSFHPWNSCDQQLQYVGIFCLIHYSGKRYFLLFLIYWFSAKTKRVYCKQTKLWTVKLVEIKPEKREKILSSDHEINNFYFQRYLLVICIFRTSEGCPYRIRVQTTAMTTGPRGTMTLGDAPTDLQGHEVHLQQDLRLVS